MAWQNPKTNWASADGVRDTDMNRIEGNTLELYNETARGSITVYVSNTGDDTNAGTSGSPYRTITRALEALPKKLAGNNVYIHIASGTYNENVTVKGFSGGDVTFTGSASDVELSKLTIDGCDVSISSITLSVTAAVGITITNGGSLYTTGNINAESSSTGVNVNTGGKMHVTGTLACPSAANAVSCSGNSMLYAGSITGIGILNATMGGVVAFGTSNLTKFTSTGGRINTGEQSSGGGVLPATVE